MAKNKWMQMLLKDEKSVLASEAVQKGRVILPSPSLNWALSGGFYKGYATCLYGPEQSGKSLISMMAIGSMHQSDPEAIAMLISTEMRVPSKERLIKMGVDPDRLVVRQVNRLEDVFDYIASVDESFENTDGSKAGPGLFYLLKEGAPIKALIIDSVKGIVGNRENSSESVAKEIMGDLSKSLGPALRKILPVIREHDLLCLLVQQVSMNMNPDEVKYQNKKWIIPSGQALKHFCETMMLVERVESKDSKIFSEDNFSMRDVALQDGHSIRCRLDKQNLDAPFREAQFQVHYRKGIVNTGQEVALLAKGLGVIKHPVNETTGKEIVAQWLFGEKKWIGWDRMVDEIEANPELQRQVMSEIHDLDRK